MYPTFIIHGLFARAHSQTAESGEEKAKAYLSHNQMTTTLVKGTLPL